MSAQKSSDHDEAKSKASKRNPWMYFAPGSSRNGVLVRFDLSEVKLQENPDGTGTITHDDGSSLCVIRANKVDIADSSNLSKLLKKIDKLIINESHRKDIADSSDLSELLKKIDKLKINESHRKKMSVIASDAADVTEAVFSRGNIGYDGVVVLVECLAMNTTLTRLDLYGCNIGDDGAAVLAACVITNTTLKMLGLRNNNIGGDGAAALGESLRKNTTLQILNLGYNDLTRASLLVLAKVFRTNTNMKKLKAETTAAEYDYVCVTNTICRGEFGSVHLGTTSRGGAEVVRKNSRGASNREGIYEALILQGLPEHPNVVKLAALNYNRKPVLVLEAHMGGNLREYARIHEDGTPIQPFFIYSHGMSLAIEHLHRHGLLHRDVGLRNYVLTEDLLTVVLVDLGLSWPIEEEKSAGIRPDERMPFRKCAPEVLTSLQYSKGADIWQLGLAFWQLLQRGRQPFSVFANGQQLVRYINKKMVGENAPIPLTFRKNGAAPNLITVVKEIVVFCCTFDPAERPTATQVVQKIEYLRSSDGVAAAAEEKEMQRFVIDKSIVDAGLGAYNYTDYGRLKTGGRSDYIDLKKDLEEHQNDELEEFPEIDLEEGVMDEEDQYQKLETLTETK